VDDHKFGYIRKLKKKKEKKEKKRKKKKPDSDNPEISHKIT
jgi:hypothetical protein